MRNPEMGCRQDWKWMRKGMAEPLKPQQKMQKGDEHPPLIPLRCAIHPPVVGMDPLSLCSNGSCRGHLI